jgi:hypothetical protein
MKKLLQFLSLLLCFFIMTAHAEVPAGARMQFSIAPQTEFNYIKRITIYNGKFQVFASGSIDGGATQRLKNFIENNNVDDALIIFNSTGGSLAEGLRLGEYIRENGFSTAVGTPDGNGDREFEGVCASSCVYAFAGGTSRFFYGKKEKLGLHQFYKDGNNEADLGDAQMLSSMLISYLQRMGVDYRAFVVASSVPGDSIYWLTPKEASELNLSNDGKQVTTAEVKIAKGYPYLKLEQVHGDGTAKILLQCYGSKVLFLSAGIITTSDVSKEKEKYITRSYLAANTTDEFLALNGNDGVKVVEDTLWLDRPTPSIKDLIKLADADNVGIWTENGGILRWGLEIDIAPVRDKINSFLNECIQ